MTSLALCVVTYLRPNGLARLLDAIADLDLEGLDVDVSVVVVDNDPEGSAQQIVEAPTRANGVRTTYVIERERGITHARNRALSVALGPDEQVDWIGWLDDDEAPRPDWLRRLVQTQRATNADVVTGPSHPTFEPDAPAWIVRTGAFDRAHFETGEQFPFFHTRTSGVIVRADVVPPERFDDRLALTGGEDRVFFTRIHRNGGTFVWDDLAVVDEWVPTSRVNGAWLIRRWFRTGVTRSLTLLYLDSPPPARRLRRVLGGVAMAVRGLVETVLALPSGRSRALMATRRIFLGIGSSYGAVGLHYREYREIHGS